MRRLCVVLCTLLIVFGAALPVLAADYTVNTSGKIYDFAEILTAEEEAQLYQQIQAFIEEYELDMTVLTVRDRSASSYDQLHDLSNRFYNTNGFGMSKGGLLLLVNMDPRGFYITAHGKAADSFSNREIDNLLEDDTFNSMMRSGEYYRAFSRFVEKSGSTISARVSVNLISSLFISFIIAAIVMGITVFMHLFSMRKVPNAQVYVNNGGFSMTHSSDRFLRTHTSRSAIPKNTGSGGGSGSSGMRGGSRGGGGRF